MRRHKQLTITIVALALCVGLTCVAAAARAASNGPDPKRLVVRLADLPTGFHWRAAGTYVTNARAQAFARKGENFTALGRTNGYESVFHGSDQGGQVTVTSDSSVFTTPAGAHKALQFIERDGNDANRYRPLAASTLGSESTFLQVFGTANTFLMAWRSGPVLSTVVVSGAQSDDAVNVAKHQQRHIGPG